MRICLSLIFRSSDSFALPALSLASCITNAKFDTRATAATTATAAAAATEDDEKEKLSYPILQSMSQASFVY